MRDPRRKVIQAFRQRVQLLVIVREWVELASYEVCLDELLLQLDLIEEALASGSADQFQRAADLARVGTQATVGSTIDQMVLDCLEMLEWLLYAWMLLFPKERIRTVCLVWEILAEWDSERDLPVVRGLYRLAAVVGCLEVLRAKQEALLRPVVEQLVG